MGKISQQIKIFIWAIFFCILEGGLVVAQLAKAVHSSQKIPPGKWILGHEGYPKELPKKINMSVNRSNTLWIKLY